MIVGYSIGYARVSTEDQNLALQLDALKAAGCGRIFEDKASGAKSDRPGLAEAMSHLRDHQGDVLVVWRLDRLGRSLPDLVATVEGLQRRGIGFRSLKESVDTSGAAGKLVFHLFAALAEFERDLIRERTNAGLAAARARGRKGGRRPKLEGARLAQARTLYECREHSIDEICRLVEVGRSTLFRSLSIKPKAD